MRIKSLVHILKHFIPYAAVLTLTFGIVYVTAQQNMRGYANSPQIEIAHDGARMLEAGNETQSVLLSRRAIDIGKDLAPYVVIFNMNGAPIAGSGLLDGKLATPPPGVFVYTGIHGEDRITWQPRPDVRSAIVVVRVESPEAGFILAGRSLKETEEQIKRLGDQVLLGWIVSLAILFLTLLVLETV